MRELTINWISPDAARVSFGRSARRYPRSAENRVAFPRPCARSRNKRSLVSAAANQRRFEARGREAICRQRYQTRKFRCFAWREGGPARISRTRSPERVHSDYSNLFTPRSATLVPSLNWCSEEKWTLADLEKFTREGGGRSSRSTSDPRFVRAAIDKLAALAKSPIYALPTSRPSRFKSSSRTLRRVEFIERSRNVDQGKKP